MENISLQFVDKLYRMTKECFPECVKHKARECLLDYVSCVIGGAPSYKDINNLYIQCNNISGRFHVFGTKTETDLLTAVMINAFNAHVLELDDSHREAMTHLGASIFSALVGVAELHACSIDQILKGAVVGYEAAVRLANAIQPGHKKRGFHVSGTCCTVGCAMGIASMLDYTKEEMVNVFSASVTSAAGLLAVISGRSEQKPYNIAHAAISGVIAALYGKCFIGAEDILGDARGFFKAVTNSINTDKLFQDGYAIESIYQKIYAACRHCHAPMEAMMKIMNENEPRFTDIDKIEVLIYDLAIKGHDHTVISGISSARQSIPYGVAVSCIYRDCGLNAFTEEKVSDPKLLELVRRVKVTEDTELSALVPQIRASVVKVMLSNGVIYSERVDFAKGEPENPITHEEWLDKYYLLTGRGGIEKDKASQIRDFLLTSGNQAVSCLFNIM